MATLASYSPIGSTFYGDDQDDPLSDLLAPPSPYSPDSSSSPSSSSSHVYASPPFDFGTTAGAGNPSAEYPDASTSPPYSSSFGLTFLPHECAAEQQHPGPFKPTFDDFLDFDAMEAFPKFEPTEMKVDEPRDPELCLERFLEGIHPAGPYLGDELGFLADPSSSSPNSAEDCQMVVESPTSSPSAPKASDVAVVPIVSSTSPSAAATSAASTASAGAAPKKSAAPKSTPATIPTVQSGGRVVKASNMASSSSTTAAAKKSSPPVVAAASPPSSPPSSPESSRSPSPTSFQGLTGLSNKPSKIQIGKGITVNLTEEELVSLDIEQIARIAGTKFTKSEERELKKLRRKSRNKVSAAQSRQKKKDYLSGLEERVESVTSLNVDLKKRLKDLEKENSLLKGRLDFLSSHVEPSIRASLPALSATETASASTAEVTKEPSLKARSKQVAAASASATTATATATTASTSLLTQAHNKGKASNGKSVGVYLLLVFLSFGVFFNVVNRTSPTLGELKTSGAQSSKDASIMPNPIVFNSPLNPAADSAPKSFVFRRMHVYDDSLMDTIPMLDHLDDNTTCNDDKFWDAYYETELQNIDFNERYKHEIVLWNECPNTDYKSHGSATILDAKVVELDGSLGLEDRIQSIKQNLESTIENVEKVVCTGVSCLVRIDHADPL